MIGKYCIKSDNPLTPLVKDEVKEVAPFANPLTRPESEEVAPVIELSMLETVLPIPLNAEEIEFIGDVILDVKFEIEPDNGFKLCNGLKAD
jgi:hypothetical protein